MFIALSFNGSLTTKYISLNNEPHLARPMLIDFNPDELSQGLHHYPFMVSLDVIEIVILLMIHQVSYMF